MAILQVSKWRALVIELYPILSLNRDRSQNQRQLLDFFVNPNSSVRYAFYRKKEAREGHLGQKTL
jgi:hypothetical protein